MKTAKMKTLAAALACALAAGGPCAAADAADATNAVLRARAAGEKYWQTKSEQDRLAWMQALDAAKHDFSKRCRRVIASNGVYKVNHDSKLACFVLGKRLVESRAGDVIAFSTADGPLRFEWKKTIVPAPGGACVTNVTTHYSAPTNWDVFASGWCVEKKKNPKPEANVHFQTSFPCKPPLSMSLMHHRPDWVAGPYADYPFPSNEVKAINQFVFALREAFPRLGFDRKEAMQGSIWIGSFDSNFPDGHTDFPPHFHIIPACRDGSQVHHFYVRREDGRITSDCYQDMSKVMDTWDRAVYFKPGDEFPFYDGTGRVVFRVKMLADGTGLDVLSPDRAHVVRVASPRPCDYVDVSERKGAGAWCNVKRIVVTDDPFAGKMETPDGVVHYDPANGKRK